MGVAAGRCPNPLPGMRYDPALLVALGKRCEHRSQKLNGIVCEYSRLRCRRRVCRGSDGALQEGR
jgi:hypothetical protein